MNNDKILKPMNYQLDVKKLQYLQLILKELKLIEENKDESKEFIIIQ